MCNINFLCVTNAKCDTNKWAIYREERRWVCVSVCYSFGTHFEHMHTLFGFLPKFRVSAWVWSFLFGCPFVRSYLVDWCIAWCWCQWEYLYLIRFLPWLIINKLRMCADGNFCTRSSRNENSSHNDEPASVSNNVQFFCYFFSHPTSPYPKLIPTVTFSLCASHAKKGKNDWNSSA